MKELILVLFIIFMVIHIVVDLVMHLKTQMHMKKILKQAKEIIERNSKDD